MFSDATRILIVDDMSTMRSLIKAQLKNMGFKQFFEAENGEVAYNLLLAKSSAKEPIQLVLSDWNMPVLSGIEFLKRVRQTPQFKELPFVLVTAEGEQGQVIEAIKHGVSNYLVKPFTPLAIQEKIAAVWKKHNPQG